MNEMTLPSRNKIRNSSHVGLRSSTLPLGHNFESSRVRGEETFVFGNSKTRMEFEPRSPISKQAALTNAPGPRPCAT